MQGCVVIIGVVLLKRTGTMLCHFFFLSDFQLPPTPNDAESHSRTESDRSCSQNLW